MTKSLNCILCATCKTNSLICCSTKSPSQTKVTFGEEILVYNSQIWIQNKFSTEQKTIYQLVSTYTVKIDRCKPLLSSEPQLSTNQSLNIKHLKITQHIFLNGSEKHLFVRSLKQLPQKQGLRQQFSSLK